MKKLLLGSLSLFFITSQAFAVTCQINANFEKSWAGKQVSVKRCLDAACSQMAVVNENYMVPTTTEAQTIEVPCDTKPQSFVVVPSEGSTMYYSPSVTVTPDNPTWSTPVTFTTTTPNQTIEEKTTIENGTVKEHEKTVEPSD